jgi:hypothetical protein
MHSIAHYHSLVGRRRSQPPPPLHHTPPVHARPRHQTRHVKRARSRLTVIFVVDREKMPRHGSSRPAVPRTQSRRRAVCMGMTIDDSASVQQRCQFCSVPWCVMTRTEGVESRLLTAQLQRRSPRSCLAARVVNSFTLDAWQLKDKRSILS